MPWRPRFPGDVPTLGWAVIEWMMEHLASPGSLEYVPFTPTQEQADFLLDFYEIDPATGKRKIRRGVISRPRGWGKSPFTGAMACVEALGPTHPAGWDAEGQPVGAPWSEFGRPLVEIAAVNEEQVSRNTWEPLLDMLTLGPAVDNYPGLTPMKHSIELPFGKIQKRTAEAGGAKGSPAHFVVCDQTEMWTKSNGGVDLYNTLKNNVTKRGGHLLESPNAYTPGVASVAENTMTAYQLVREGKTRLEGGLLVSHREAPPDTDMTDSASLLAGLAVAYGDSADVERCSIHEPACVRPGWVDLENIKASIWEPDADVQLSRSDWLNQVTHASDAWVSQPDWAACADVTKVVADRDVVVLGFDGSRGRVSGQADATALIGCRVSDGHLFELEIWEAKPHERDWAPDEAAVNAAVHKAFSKYQVVGFYADPSMWDGHLAAWEAAYRDRLKVKVSASQPMRWPKSHMTRVVAALESMRIAIVNKELSHDGATSLTRHVLNARRRTTRAGMFIAKEYPKSPAKVDGAYAAMLAWQARLDCVAAGVNRKAAPSFVPRRIY